MDVTEIIARASLKRLSAKSKANLASVQIGYDLFGARVGLDQPHRLAQYLAQVAHESAGFRYDREIWGPTAAQKRYEGRRDLGNTQPGDGKRFAGHGPIQVTGRYNHREYSAWAKRLDPNAPDFEAYPEKINTDPWEGLSAIWYWDSRNLNRYADQGDIEMITCRINGGLNGYADRLQWYDRISLVMLGFDKNDISGFQKAAGLTIDGLSGPRTRAALHKRLVALTKLPSEDVQTAPVVEEKKVVPREVETKVKNTANKWSWLTGLFGGAGTGLAGLTGADWQTIAVLGGIALTVLLIIVLMRVEIADAISKFREA